MESSIHWPYDEVTLKPNDLGLGFVIETPWMNTKIQVAQDHLARVKALADKFSSGKLGPEHLGEINWLFRPLTALPLCYTLPRRKWPASLDYHRTKDKKLQNLVPIAFLLQCAIEPAHASDVAKVAQDPIFSEDWRWDLAGALQFAKSDEGIDPLAFFSVVRRYHLLSAVEDNQTQRLYDFVKQLLPNTAAYHDACALMVRQNHYVTARCHQALTPALDLAQKARAQVQEFIAAEHGHDRILDIAIRSLGTEPDTIPVNSHTKVLMDLLQFAAQRNFLAFAMAVDFFERSSYQNADPLAMLLSEGGMKTAARQINKHMDINDAGGHENVAAQFLNFMGPIDRDYAEEALHLAEVITHVMNRISFGDQSLLNSKT
jgi:hypothetical protein